MVFTPEKTHLRKRIWRKNTWVGFFKKVGRARNVVIQSSVKFGRKTHISALHNFENKIDYQLER